MVLLLLWELMVGIFQIPKWLLPAPSRVLQTLYLDRALLLGHTLTTLSETISGFFIALLFAILIALLMDASSWMRKILYPLMIVSQTIPIITIAPLLVIWLGFGMGPKIAIVVLICFFPVCMSLLQGLSQIDRDYMDLMKTMGASSRDLFFHLKLPSVLPSFFSGLKISATYSVMGAVIAEWLGAKAGLGEYMRRTLHTFSIERTFAAIVIVVTLSLLMVGIIHRIAYLAMPWQKPSKTNEELVEEESL
jgi:ABC-type nitrate/sulfonate/bicarbonate transport system permease component